MMSLQNDFVKRVYPHALKVQKETGVPALAAMAQTVTETGWGKSAPGNMYFGMKATGKSYGGWNGEKQLLKTTEYHSSPNKKYPEVISVTKVGNKYKYRVRDYFRAYDTPYGSFKDYAGLLSKLSRYRKAFDYTDNPEQFAREVAKGGYATAPNYADYLVKIIKSLRKRIKDLGLDKPKPTKMPWEQ